MKGKYINIAMAVLAVTACSQDQNPDVPLVIPDPIEVYEGSGPLLYSTDETELDGCTYSWRAEGNSIVINVNIDTEEVMDYGDWEMGHFTLPSSQINDFLGVFVSELDESTFYALEPDGSVVEEMTSYKPGMWIDADSRSCGWSDGAFYWQWYVWGGKTDKNGDVIEYDLDYTQYPSRFMIGTNPANTPDVAGKTVTSKAVISVGGQKYDFIVNVIFSGAEIPEDTTTPVADVKGTKSLVTMDQKCVETAHSISWSLTDTLMKFDVTISLAEAGEDWALGYIKYDMTMFNSFLTDKSIDTLGITDFYPVEPDGTPLSSWNCYAPGEWVTVDGEAANWDDKPNHSYWWLAAGKTSESEPLGAMCFGQCPGEPAVGDSVVSRASLCGIPFRVTFKYVE